MVHPGWLQSNILSNSHFLGWLAARLWSSWLVEYIIIANLFPGWPTTKILSCAEFWAGRSDVLPKSHHLAGKATTPSPVVREPARAEKAYRTTAIKKKSRFRTRPVNTGYYLDIWVASVRRRRRWRPPGLRVVDLTLTQRFQDKLSMVDLRWHSGVLADGWTSLRRDRIKIASV
jgi:hypothetical protein